MSENDQAAMHVLSDTMFGKGWSRTLPPSIIALFAETLIERPPPRTQLDARLRLSPHSPEGMDTSAWEPLHDWTDDELRRLDADFGEPGDEPRPASEVKEQEAAQREANLATFERYLAAKGLPVAHTLGALLDLLIACEVISVDDHGGHLINPLAPLPEEVLPLDADEAALQDQMRWDVCTRPPLRRSSGSSGPTESRSTTCSPTSVSLPSASIAILKTSEVPSKR